MKSGNSKRLVVVTAVVGAILVAVVSAFALNIPGFGKYQATKTVNGVVTIPVAKVSDGKAHYYQFEDGGKNIAFVVVKASDGLYRTAFDACDSCFRAKKGYEQKGDMLVCQNCNKQFAISRIAAHEVGGCNPSFLPSQASANSIIITAADLKTGARYF
jgi:uncharacterized membrane protein